MTAEGVDGSAGDATADGSSDQATSAGGSSERSTGAPRCPHCEAPMYKRHCKYVCPQHGVIIDCSDPFR